MVYLKRLFWLPLLLAALAAAQAIPTPQQYFGFPMGADRKLARYDKIVSYFQQVAKQSDRVRVENLGPTTEGHPYVMAIISSPENLKNLDNLRDLERKLYFQGGAPTAAEQAEIFSQGRAVVLIDNNIHSTEIGSSQMVVDLIYRLATSQSPDDLKILNDDILLLIPSQNPDGQMMVTDWYDKYLGTPQEGGPMPFLYQKYVGHDDNRDMYLFSQNETKLLGKVLWHDWFPSVWLDEHQQGDTGPRMFTMPATDPINPNVDPLIYRLNSIYGQSQAAAMEAKGMTGIIYNATYTNYWEGALAWAGWWHNQVGLLTEAASVRIATPTMQQMADPNHPPPPETGGGRGGFGGFDRGPNAILPAPRDIASRTEYPRPWLGGRWTLKDIVDYEMTATMALLRTTSNRREELLHNIYGVNARTIELGAKGELGFGDARKNFAAILPLDGQHDANEVRDLVWRLQLGGVEVKQATAAFTSEGKTYPAGTFVIPFDQVFGRYAKDMLEKQTYPLVRRAPNAPAEAPYDVSGWSLGMQFGVNTVFAHQPLPAGLALTAAPETPAWQLAAQSFGNGFAFNYTGPESALVVNRLLKAGASVTLAAPGVAHTTADAAAWKQATAGFQVDNDASLPAATGAALPVKATRVGVYQSWTGNMDEGWTRWVLDHYQFPYTTLHNPDIQGGNLRARFDTIVLPDQPERSIMEGNNSNSMPAEYRGGIGEAGWKALVEFVHQGGSLVAMGNACNLLIDRLPLPLTDLKHSLNQEQFFGPGSVVHLDVDTSTPLGLGMAANTWAYYINTPFFDVHPGFGSQQLHIIARFPNSDVNASGWLRGEDYMYGKAAVVAINTQGGRVVLFGIRPQHRAQTRATFLMLFNALYGLE